MLRDGLGGWLGFGQGRDSQVKGTGHTEQESAELIGGRRAVVLCVRAFVRAGGRLGVLGAP